MLKRKIWNPHVQRMFQMWSRWTEMQDDYATLKCGHWWQWRNETHKKRYKIFIENLLAASPKLDAFHLEYPNPLPTPYKCPAEESCKGGLDSPVWKWVRRSTMQCLQFRIQQTIENLRRMAVNVMNCGPVVDNCCLWSILMWTSRRKTKKKREGLAIDKLF